jgi:hypothetical protein
VESAFSPKDEITWEYATKRFIIVKTVEEEDDEDEGEGASGGEGKK